MINPNTLLSEEEIAILRDSKDWRNYLAIFNIWAQIALGFIIFSFFPFVTSFNCWLTASFFSTLPELAGWRRTQSFS